MNVLIVARTKMSGDWRCFGGLAEDGRPVRLLNASGFSWRSNIFFQVGQVWTMDLKPPRQVHPPHTEDVLASGYRFLRDEPDLKEHLLRRIKPWQGGIRRVFEGHLGFSRSGNGYICKRLGIPNHSTGFWIPDRDLVLRDDGKHFDYFEERRRHGLSFVGEEPPPRVLPAGTLIRVSLARWWKPADSAPDFEERCYLQISGWYK